MSEIISFFKAIDVALAHLPGDDIQLTADSGRWSQVAQKFKKSPQHRVQEIFRSVHFTDCPPLPLQSDEVNDYLFFAGLSGILTTSSPDYNEFSLTRQAKDTILERTNPKILEEYNTEFKVMTEGLSVLVIS